jgi:transcriptional regulator with XRE-family HTH domain
MTKKRPSTIVGQRIYALRQEKGLTLVDFAQRAGLDQGGLCRIEKGESTEPRLPTMIKIADALNTSLDYLSGRVDAEPSGVGQIHVDKVARDLFDAYTLLLPDNQLDLVRYAHYLRTGQKEQ